MKKLLLLILFALSLSSLAAIAYTPDASFSFYGNFTRYSQNVDSLDSFRATMGFEGRINVLAMTIENKVRLSMPLSISYLLQTAIEERTRILERVRYQIGLRVDSFISSYFSIFVVPTLGYTSFPKIKAGSLFMALEVGPMFNLGNHVALSIPFKGVIAKSEIDLEVGVALSIYPLGLREKTR